MQKSQEDREREVPLDKIRSSTPVHEDDEIEKEINENVKICAFDNADPPFPLKVFLKLNSPFSTVSVEKRWTFEIVSFCPISTSLLMLTVLISIKLNHPNPYSTLLHG
jgi:hypothetical protein